MLPHPTMLYRYSSRAVIDLCGGSGELYLRPPSLSRRCALVRYRGCMRFRWGSLIGDEQRALSCPLALWASLPPRHAITLYTAAAPMGISIESGAVSSEKDVLCNTAPKPCFLLDDLRIVSRWQMRANSLPWLRKRQVAVLHMRPEDARDTTPLGGATPLETQYIIIESATYDVIVALRHACVAKHCARASYMRVLMCLATNLTHTFLVAARGPPPLCCKTLLSARQRSICGITRLGMRTLMDQCSRSRLYAWLPLGSSLLRMLDRYCVILGPLLSADVIHEDCL